jgi:cytochrome c-type protein NapC
MSIIAAGTMNIFSAFFNKIQNLFIYSWRRFLCSSFKYAFLTLLATFMTGVFVWGGFNWAMELSNNETFCISCHEMKQNVFVEYQNTIHYANRTGVRATCPDCHVPKDWHHMVVRKIMSSHELIQHFRRTINTREKFLARRPYLTRIVLNSMKRSDSRECRNCHNFSYMDNIKQEVNAGKIHIQAMEKDMTCVDCHMGIAHELPEEFLDAEHQRFEQEDLDCSYCHTGMAQAPTDEDWNWEF